MGQGFGHVMHTVYGLLEEDSRERWWAYRDIAAIAYDVSSPSRAQLTAVARAARRLQELGYVDIVRANPNDRRITYVVWAG